MARRMVPRRLSHDEEATLVEHLTELRHRLLICIFAIVPAFAIAYAFHSELIRRLMDLVPEGTPIVTLGVTEPFTTAVKVSLAAAFAVTCCFGADDDASVEPAAISIRNAASNGSSSFGFTTETPP